MQKSYTRSLFDSIAHRYDLLNHLLSGGIDFYWRRRAVGHLRDIQPKRLLDVATGTADFAIATLRLHPEEIVGVDMSEKMVSIGREKIRRRRSHPPITLHSGDAEDLQFSSEYFDAVIVAFGVRNFENLERGLREMYRVLRQGGKIVVLEFSRPAFPLLKHLYFFYFLNVLPFIGRLVSKSKEAYTYLPATVLNFPESDAFLSILQRTGFIRTQEERLTFGVATIYTGIK